MNLKCKQISLETTNKCSSDCIICPRSKYTSRRQEMDMGLFKKIIKESIDYNLDVIEICGYGEPFTDSLLFDRCEFIKKVLPKVKIYLTTTGFSMDVKKVIKYIDMIKISFYGINKKTYEKIHRGKLVFEKNLENILALINNRDKTPYIMMSYIYLPETSKNLSVWVNFWKNLSDELLVWTPHNWAGLKHYRNIEHGNQVSCGRPFYGPPHIHVDGTVSICSWDINKKLVIGNLNNSSIDEIYHSEEFKYIQHRHSIKKFKGLLCEKCCQTNKKYNGLIYSSKSRKSGALTSNKLDLRATDAKQF